MLVLVFLPFIQKEELMGYMASEWSYKNQHLSCRGKFKFQIQVQISGEFESSEFELSRSHVTNDDVLNLK